MVEYHGREMKQTREPQNPTEFVDSYSPSNARQKLASTEEANYARMHVEAESAAWIAQSMSKLASAMDLQTDAQVASGDAMLKLTKAYVMWTRVIAVFTGLLFVIAVLQTCSALQQSKLPRNIESIQADNFHSPGLSATHSDGRY